MQSMWLKINSPEVVHEVFEDEVVIVNLDSGNYYSLEGAGADIWREIENGRSVEEITGRIAGEYDSDTGEIESAVHHLIAELQEEKLVRTSDDAKPETGIAHASGEAPLRERRKFEPLVLNRFTDMQELLLLDPVHDVDETGWPRAKESLGG